MHVEACRSFGEACAQWCVGVEQDTKDLNILVMKDEYEKLIRQERALEAELALNAVRRSHPSGESPLLRLRVTLA